MDERSENGGYRYGFQGSERDDEVKGSGNSYTTHFRQLDPRIGRWLSVDPMMAKFPWQSPYVSFDNNPILLPDPSGGETEGDFYNEAGKWLGSDDKVDDRVYIAESVTKNDAGIVTSAEGKKELGITHSEFKQFASTVYHESSGEKEESFGIASAISNYSQSSGKSIGNLTTPSSTYTYGAGAGPIPSGKENSRYEFAAVINALNGGFDYSMGGTHWDGRDLLINGTSHFRFQKAANDSRQGIHISNDKTIFLEYYIFNVLSYLDKKGYYSTAVNIFNEEPFMNSVYSLAYNVNALWDVTSAFGQTLFFKQLPVNSGKTSNVYSISLSDILGQLELYFIVMEHRNK